MTVRRRTKQVSSLEDRLAAHAKKAREAADKLPPGAERDDLMEKVRETEAASALNKILGQPQG